MREGKITMNKNINCFNCKHQKMCHIFKTVFHIPLLDGNSVKYNENFKTLFISVGNLCQNYENDKNKEYP